jgi:hypothetical protein
MDAAATAASVKIKCSRGDFGMRLLRVLGLMFMTIVEMRMGRGRRRGRRVIPVKSRTCNEKHSEMLQPYG